MKHIAIKSAFHVLFVILLLIMGTVSVSAQYQMVVYTDDGLSVSFPVDDLDSVSYRFVDAENDVITTTGKATDISMYSASVQSWANVNDYKSSCQIGVIFSTTGTPSINNGTQQTASVSIMEDDGNYSIQLTNIAPSTTYYYRSFVYRGGVFFLGNVQEFATMSQGVNLTTGESVSKLTCYSAKVDGTVSIDPATEYSDFTYGICYGKTTEPTANDNRVQANSKDSEGKFTCQLKALTGSTTYYYRSYAYVDGYFTYGPVKSFTTKDDDVVVTGNIDMDTYTVSSTLTMGLGAYSTLQFGVCYGNIATPTVNGYSVNSVTTNEIDDEGNYLCSLPIIPFGKVYYRSFVKIDESVHYGAVKIFDGNAVITGDIDTITYVVKSHIVSTSGFSSNVYYGVCYGTNELPTCNYNQTAITYHVDDDGNYNVSLTKIPFADTLYYRSWVKIGIEIYYGDVKFCKGNSVTTGDIDTISYVVKSHIVSNAGYSKVVYGVCYGTNEFPTYNDQNVTTNSADDEGNYNLSLTNLPFVDTLYYRSYVKIGTKYYYGDVKYCKGNSVITGDIDTITYAVKSHIVSNAGFSNVVYGVCYGTNELPTYNDQNVTTNSADDEGNYNLSLIKIPFADTLNYRSYVKIGTKYYYGDVKSCKGNSVTTGDIDTITFVVKSHIVSNAGFSNVVYGVCYGTNEFPTYNDQNVISNSVNDEGNYNLSLTNVPFADMIYYRSYVKVDKECYYGEVKSFRHMPDVNGYEYVDLGLSVLWATCNVGATTPEEYGDYFAWGETEPKTNCEWSTYKYCNGSNTTFTKYNVDSRYGTVDKKTTLDPEDDAAHINWGGSWRMPTQAEFNDLINKCTWTWTTQNGVNGYKVKSKKSGYTDRSIFLPAAGCRYDIGLGNVGYLGDYWSSSLDTDVPYSAWVLNFRSGSRSTGSYHRYCGLTVRPVCQ